jgi:hypothetical protein
VIDDDRLEQQYAELRADPRDQRTRQVLDDLDRAYAATPPAALQDSLYVEVQKRAAEFERVWRPGEQNAVRGRAARPRLLWHWRSLTACVAAIALFASLARVPLMQHFISRQPQATDAGAAWPSLLANTGSPIGVSISLCGYVLTIDRAYADANDVLVAYRVTPPNGLGVHNVAVDLGLQGDRGRPLRGISGYGMAPNSQGEFTMIESFDASGVKGTPTALGLQLVVRSIEVFADHNPPKSPAPPCLQDNSHGAAPDQLPSITAENAQGNEKQMILRIKPPKLNGPARLGFAVPYLPRSRVATLHKVVHVGSSWLEINSVVVTPAETRVYLRGKVDELYPTSFSVDGQSYGIDVQALADNGLTADFYVFNLYNMQGEWSFSFPPRQPGGPTQYVRFPLPGPAYACTSGQREACAQIPAVRTPTVTGIGTPTPVSTTNKS